MSFKLSDFGLGFKRSDFDRDKILIVNLLEKTLTIKLAKGKAGN